MKYLICSRIFLGIFIFLILFTISYGSELGGYLSEKLIKDQTIDNSHLIIDHSSFPNSSLDIGTEGENEVVTYESIIFLALLIAAVLLTIGGFTGKQTTIIFIASGFWLFFAGYCYSLRSSESDIYWLMMFFSMFVAIVVGIAGITTREGFRNPNNKVIYEKASSLPKRAKVQDEDLWETEKSDSKDQYQFYREQMDAMRTKPIGNRRRIRKIREAKRIDRSGRI